MCSLKFPGSLHKHKSIARASICQSTGEWPACNSLCSCNVGSEVKEADIASQYGSNYRASVFRCLWRQPCRWCISLRQCSGCGPSPDAQRPCQVCFCLLCGGNGLEVEGAMLLAGPTALAGISEGDAVCLQPSGTSTIEMVAPIPVFSCE